MHDPRGPTGGGGGPSRYPTFRPGGGGGGGGLDDGSGGRGGMVFEDPYRFRPTMSSSSGYGPGAASAAATGHATAHPSDFLPTSYGPGATTTSPHQAHVSPPLRRPNYDATDFTASAESRQQNVMYSVPQRGGGGVDGGSYETMQEPNLYRSSNGGNGMYHAMNESGPFTSAATGAAAAGAAAGPSSSSASNLKSAMKRNVGFEDGAAGGPSMETEHLSRPRAEETARGEASAGALPDKRDGLGTL